MVATKINYTSIHITITLLVCFFCLFSETSGQSSSPETYTVSYENKTLKKILKDLNRISSVRFSYSSGKINDKQKISYSASNKTLSQIISDIAQKAHFSYQWTNGYYILKEKNEEISIPKRTVIKTETFTISGYITDAENEEALIGATFYDPDTYKGATTNNYGFFSITLRKGNYNFKCSYIGYQSQNYPILLNQDIRLDINLSPHITYMKEVMITKSDKEQEIKHFRSGQINQSPIDAQKQVMALGESDMLKSLDKLPGISFHGDGSSYFYVRGGNRDQNLILLDEAPIYNPSHLLGLFTPIIPEAIKSTKVYKADFPIQYGGRLSSVIDIRTRDGNMERFTGSGSIGLLANRLTIEGPIKKDASSYFISFRRSHFGAFLKRIEPGLQEFYFNDFTAKLNLRIKSNDRLFLTFYSGKDKFYLPQSGLDWGNNTFTARWNHIFGKKLFLNTTLYSSKYLYRLYPNGYAHNWESSIQSTHIKPEFTYYHQPGNTFRFGLKMGNYAFVAGYPSWENGNFNPNTPSPVNSNETTLYAGNELELSKKLKIISGVRLTNWSNRGKAFMVYFNKLYEIDSIRNYKESEKFYSHLSFEPQVSLSYFFSKQNSLSISYNKNTQHINLINNSISPFNSLEIWLPSGPNIKPQKANAFNLAYVRASKNQLYEFQADIYYKRLYNQIGYKAHAKILLNALLEREIRQGDGKAYGIDLIVRKQKGKLRGQVSYSFTRSLLSIDGLNNNQSYRTLQDRPLDLNIDLYYQIKARWELSFNYNYASGICHTTPVSFYYYQGKQIPVYDKINNSRLPDYQRLDISSDFTLNKTPKRFEHHLQISVFNFLNQINPIFINFNKSEINKRTFKIPTDADNYQELVTTQRYIYSFIPSITYNFKF